VQSFTARNVTVVKHKVKQIMIKTIVKELTGRKRRLLFAGPSGKDIFANEVIVLEGCYPDACDSDSSKENFINELKFGGIRIAYASNHIMFPMAIADHPEDAFADNVDKRIIEMEAEVKEKELKLPAEKRPKAKLAKPAAVTRERIEAMPEQTADVVSKLMAMAGLTLKDKDINWDEASDKLKAAVIGTPIMQDKPTETDVAGNNASTFTLEPEIAPQVAVPKTVDKPVTPEHDALIRNVDEISLDELALPDGDSTPSDDDGIIIPPTRKRTKKKAGSKKTSRSVK